MAFGFTYTFEEAPLFIDLGYSVGLINGEAEISFDLDGEWSIASISIEGFKVGEKPKMVEVCRDSHAWLFRALTDHLEGPCKNSIEAEIQSQVEQHYDDVGSRAPTHAELYA